MLVVGRNNFNEENKIKILENIKLRIDESIDKLKPDTAINITLLGVKILEPVRDEFTNWCLKEVENELKNRNMEVKCVGGYEGLIGYPSIYIALK